MFQSTGSGNNKFGFSTWQEKRCIRSQEYYYEDGSVVFSVGDVLFKLQALLFKADAGVDGYKFEAIMKTVIDNITADKPGSNDADPIVLPLDPHVFTMFLLAVVSRVGDPKLTEFLTLPDESKHHTPKLLIDYLDVGVTASYFGMKNLESWIHSRIQLILKSAQSLAGQQWPHNSLQRLSMYLQTTDMPESQDELLGLMLLILSRPAPAPFGFSMEVHSLNIQTSVELYKTPNLATSNPALFGFVFMTVLSLGHQSSYWSTSLTRDHRVILFAAHVDLTRFCDHRDLKLGWLIDQKPLKDVCSAGSCSQTFDSIWRRSFAQCKRLDSIIPLEDVKQILALPRYRCTFVQQSSSWQCSSGCAQKSISKIDVAMRESFCGFTDKHEVWARGL